MTDAQGQAIESVMWIVLGTIAAGVFGIGYGLFWLVGLRPIVGGILAILVVLAGWHVYKRRAAKALANVDKVRESLDDFLLVVPLFVLLLASCSQASKSERAMQNAELPSTVPVTVYRYKPLPDWAKQQIHVPPSKSDLVGDRLEHEEALNVYLQLANCRFGLLADLDAGHAADPFKCKEPTP